MTGMRLALSKKPYFKRIEMPRSTVIILEHVVPKEHPRPKLTKLLSPKRRQYYRISSEIFAIMDLANSEHTFLAQFIGPTDVIIVEVWKTGMHSNTYHSFKKARSPVAFQSAVELLTRRAKSAGPPYDAGHIHSVLFPLKHISNE
jgi:hypothetical protein